jgi:thymidylate synthase
MKKYFEADNIDDLYVDLIREVTTSPEYTVSPRGFDIKEILHPTIVLTNPKNCLVTLKDRKLNYAFTAIEKLEYMSGNTNPDRLSYYNKNFGSFLNEYNLFDGAYAERLIYWFRYIYNLLKKDRDSRQAVSTIYGQQDRHTSKDIPCTIMHHYMIRENKLHMITYMRSNDLLWGFPYDVNAFCFLQSVMARMLGVELGTYTHIAGSLHSYNERENQLTRLLESTEKVDIKNPELPETLSYEQLQADLAHFWYLENQLRNGKELSDVNGLPEYLATYFELINKFKTNKDDRQANK